VALIVALLCALPLAFLAKPSGLALWGASLVCELLHRHGHEPVLRADPRAGGAGFRAVAGFYLLSRSMTAMQIIAAAPLHEPTLADRIVKTIVESIAFLLPALDGMTQTAWLLGGVSLGFASAVFGQTAIYLVLLCSAALFDLHRRNFLGA